ncbi:MAG TPA: acetate/propionate family kinase [Candidatus Latescibacteria bacterium]|nr:acetate/propionate family kinase [Candidatus Latescibacterota bacterium]
MRILVANVGSTSFKYKLFDMEDETVLAEGRIERVGETSSPSVHWVRGEEAFQGEVSVLDYPSAIRNALGYVERAIGDLSRLSAVGFKTVHLRGEPGAYLLTEEVLSRMEEYNFVAPIHNPPYVRAVRIFRELLPEVSLVGLFEPAFHREMPDYAYIYGVPYRWYEEYGIRRYGFHGASHRYISERVPEMLGVSSEGLRLVSCHLGGSSSVCAISGGKSVDTSMGFSPQEGVLNATRTGDVDVFAVLYVMEHEGLSPVQMAELLCRQGGLLGLSGISGDVRDLEEAAEKGDERARLALEAFCYGVKKYIGAYAAALGGLDALAFAGGIGERGWKVRERICKDLGFLGVRLDPKRNRRLEGEGMISDERSHVKVLVIRTDEELIVAREVRRVVEGLAYKK